MYALIAEHHAVIRTAEEKTIVAIRAYVLDPTTPGALAWEPWTRGDGYFTRDATGNRVGWPEDQAFAWFRLQCAVAALTVQS